VKTKTSFIPVVNGAYKPPVKRDAV